MNPLCLAFQKYLLGTSCTEQYSHLIPQTGKPLNVWLSMSLKQIVNSWKMDPGRSSSYSSNLSPLYNIYEENLLTDLMKSCCSSG